MGSTAACVVVVSSALTGAVVRCATMTRLYVSSAGRRSAPMGSAPWGQLPCLGVAGQDEEPRQETPPSSTPAPWGFTPIMVPMGPRDPLRR